MTTFEPRSICPIASINLSMIIKCLSYSELVRNNIIPNLQLPKPTKTKRYPKFVYDTKNLGVNNAPELFESLVKFLFMDIQSQNINSQNIQSEANRKWQELTQINIQVDLKLINEILNFMNNTINSFRSTQNVTLNYSINQSKICSIIDVYITNWMFNIRIATNYDETSILELLCQKCILDFNKSNTKSNYIGLMLPIYEGMYWFDVSSWDSSKLFDILNVSSHASEQDICVRQPPNLNSLFGICNINVFGFPCKRVSESDIGYHVAKNGEYPTNVPFQTFISNPQGMDMVSENEMKNLMLRKSPSYKWFVHAAYTINLCNSNDINVRKLENEYYVSRMLECKGVVFHVGSSVNLSYTEGFSNMVAGMKRVLQNVTEQTPLLIETPAGEGTEIGSSYESFCTLLEQFLDVLGSKLKVCVDTCHVFNMGYDPLWFIDSLLRTYPNSVGLVHFNDSQNERGSRVDRHFIPGLGYIGYERMMNVYTYCKSNNIPLIQE